MTTRKSITVEQAFGLAFIPVAAATFLALAGEVLLLQGTWCIPMYGKTGGPHADALVATVVTAVLSVVFLKVFRVGRPLKEALPLVLAAAGGIGLGLYLALGSVTSLLSFGMQAQISTYTVSVARVEGAGEDYPNVDEPDCLWAYHFANPATGLDDFQCTESNVPFKVGTKIRLVERSNYFGSCTLKVEPVSGRG